MRRAVFKGLVLIVSTVLLLGVHDHGPLQHEQATEAELVAAEAAVRAGNDVGKESSGTPPAAVASLEDLFGGPGGDARSAVNDVEAVASRLQRFQALLGEIATMEARNGKDGRTGR